MNNINVEVVRTSSREQPFSVLKRFSRRLNAAGITRRVRKTRYTKRVVSKNVRRAQALRRIERMEERMRLYRLGKIGSLTENPRRN